MTASNLSQKLGASVAIGHTQIGIDPNHAHDPRHRRAYRWGFEVGCILDFKSPGFKYMKGMANWTQGFGVLHVDGNKVYPQAVPFNGNSFVFEGKFTWK